MHPVARSASLQRGYSLIEVMVAITIALFLMGGALTIVQHTGNAFKAQGQLTQLQDSERMAMALMTDVIQSTGYYPNPHNFTDAQTLISPSFAVPGAPNIATVPDPAAIGDTITVRYAAGPLDNVYNCRGDQNTGAGAFETWENTFSVVQVAAAPPGGAPQFQLQCKLWSLSTAAFVTTPLVNGVQNLTIQYGINTAGAGAVSCADRYKATKDMQPADWSNVCAVKVTLTFANPFNPPGGTKPTIDFTRVIAVMNQV